MYDLEKVFNSTLELDDLLEMIAKKFADVMNVQAVNLWMVNGKIWSWYARRGSTPQLRLEMRSELARESRQRFRRAAKRC